MPRSLCCFILLLALSGVGCHHCGERHYLFPRLHERLSEHDDPKGSSSALAGSGKDCCPDGHPVSRNGAGFGGGEVIYSGPYPAGQPYVQPANPRSDELPQPGGYITPPGVPYAPQRPIDSTKFLPKSSGGTMTGDPRK